MRLGWLSGLGALVVVLLSVVQLGMTQVGSVVIPILAVLSFLGWFFFFAFPPDSNARDAMSSISSLDSAPHPMLTRCSKWDCPGISSLRGDQAEQGSPPNTVPADRG